MNLGLVSQPAELRCLSDKLSAVNIERRCRGERVGELGGCSCGEAGGGGSPVVGAIVWEHVTSLLSDVCPC